MIEAITCCNEELNNYVFISVKTKMKNLVRLILWERRKKKEIQDGSKKVQLTVYILGILNYMIKGNIREYELTYKAKGS